MPQTLLNGRNSKQREDGQIEERFDFFRSSVLKGQEDKENEEIKLLADGI